MEPAESPDSWMMSAIEVPENPRRSKQARAASMICRRRAFFVSSLSRGM
jgi:hypothetical protein